MAGSEQPLILLADGDAERRRMVQQHLRSIGLAVLPVADGEAALAALADPVVPALAIVDAALAGRDGFGVCEAIKRDPRTWSIPVVMVTSSDAVEDRVRAMDLGADDFLLRPVDLSELAARVRSLLRVKAAHDAMAAEIHRLARIGIALSSEHHLGRLLERIVDEARAINNADAGSLYTVDWDARVLNWEVIQNESLGTHLGAELVQRFARSPVPLQPTNVSAYAALTGESVNIPDVYAAEGFDFSGPRIYDSVTGYRSRSMLVVPMRNHEDEVIGVLQLINAKDPATGNVVPFPARNVERTQALASQAGIAITNARLIGDLQALLDGVIQAMVRALDEKSRYTHGHIQRVTRLSLLLAQAVNDCRDNRFGGKRFSRDELNELRVAGLMHDIGKIVVPEHVVDKATKLQTVYDRIAEIRTRFSAIRLGMENAALRRELELVKAGASRESIAAVRQDLARKTQELAEDLAFLESINYGSESMAPDQLARLHAIAARTYVDEQGVDRPFLTESEVRYLAIPRGTLLPDEMALIRNHVAVTARLLSDIPFPRKLRNVPTFAGEHHEMLNGSGYPAGKTADQLPLQSRILAIADIYDALTSADRPYKKAFTPEDAFAILRREADEGRLDARLVDLFISARCHEQLGKDDDLPANLAAI